MSVVLLALAPAVRAEFGPGEPRFRALYKELVETNTTLSAGSCTLAAERMAAHLKAAVFAGPDIGNVHGLNEYLGVDSLLQGREFMYQLVKTYAEQP
jgi:acetylornithine deacetylase/succinyl-diaminopimelate desuccinylase-like protein